MIDLIMSHLLPSLTSYDFHHLEKLLPFLHKKSHFNFNPDKEAALELHGKARKLFDYYHYFFCFLIFFCIPSKEY